MENASVYGNMDRVEAAINHREDEIEQNAASPLRKKKGKKSLAH